MSEKIRDCHYVPQTYQKQWLYDENKLFYYLKSNKQKVEKGGNKTGLYRPQKQMFIRDYYDTTLENINFLEVYFNRNFENKWVDHLDSIRATININLTDKDQCQISKKDFSNESLSLVLEFMAIQYFRIYDNAISKINESITSTGHSPNSISEEDKKEAWKGGLIDISSGVGYAPMLLDFFKDLTVNFYISNDPSFILADNPVIEIRDNESKGISFLFPLAPNICIEVNNLKSDTVTIMNVENTFVKNINFFLYNNCRFVFGYDKEITDMDDVIPPND